MNGGSATAGGDPLGRWPQSQLPLGHRVGGAGEELTRRDAVSDQLGYPAPLGHPPKLPRERMTGLAKTSTEAPLIIP